MVIPRTARQERHQSPIFPETFVSNEGFLLPPGADAPASVRLRRDSFMVTDEDKDQLEKDKSKEGVQWGDVIDAVLVTVKQQIS